MGARSPRRDWSVGSSIVSVLFYPFFPFFLLSFSLPLCYEYMNERVNVSLPLTVSLAIGVSLVGTLQSAQVESRWHQHMKHL
jgi:hypothetical protein